MPGDEAPEKIHTLLLYLLYSTGLSKTCMHNSEFLRPNFSLLSMVHIRVIPMRLRLGLSLTGWVTLHLKCTITLYGNCLLIRMTLERYSLNLKITLSQLKMSIIVGICSAGYIPLSSNLSSSDFMIRLRDIVKNCQFEKPDEIVKFLFLTHNQNPKVREELLKPMKEGDGLNDILGYAHLVEGNQHSEHLSKMYLDSVKPSNKTIEAVDKKGNKKVQGGSRQQQNSKSKFRSQSRDKKGCHNCGSKHPPKHCPMFGKECYHCKKKNHFSNLCRSRHRSQSNGQRSQSQSSRFS